MRYLKTTTGKQIRNKINLLFWIIISLQVVTSFSFGQDFMLGGKVTDKKTGEPIYDAKIAVDKNENIISTDFDGIYSLKVKLNDTIVIQFTGMKTQRIKVDSVLFNIELEEIEALNVKFGPPIRPIKTSNNSIPKVTIKEIKKR